MTDRIFVAEWSHPQHPVMVDASFAPHITTEVTPMILAEGLSAITCHVEALIEHAQGRPRLVTHRELLGTVTDGGKVHLAHNAPDTYPEDRTTFCTDNNRAEAQRAITRVLGQFRSGPGPVTPTALSATLLATVRGLDLPPGRLCGRCFDPSLGPDARSRGPHGRTARTRALAQPEPDPTSRTMPRRAV